MSCFQLEFLYGIDPMSLVRPLRLTVAHRETLPRLPDWTKESRSRGPSTGPLPALKGSELRAPVLHVGSCQNCSPFLAWVLSI